MDSPESKELSPAMRPIQPLPPPGPSSSEASATASGNSPRGRPDLTLPLPQQDPFLAVPSRQQLSITDLDLVNRIGSGSGGTVYKVVHRPTGHLYALKVINGNHEDSVRRLIRREIEIFLDVDHPNVVKCYDMFDHNGEIQVLLEFMDGGSLDGTHIAHEPRLADVARQVLSGIAYLHRRKIVHCDIKPSNLLINSCKNVKIAGFGVNRILAQTMDPCNSSVGTIAYTSPERINTNLNRGQYDVCAEDIWSFGVSILEFFLGRFPFAVPRGGDCASLINAIVMQTPPKAPDTASNEFRDFIDCCLRTEPGRRWTANQLLQHPFVVRIEGRRSSASRFADLMTAPKDVCNSKEQLLSSKEDSPDRYDAPIVGPRLLKRNETAVDPRIEPKKRRRCFVKKRTVLPLPLHGSSALLDDGFSWRKYGQKNILGEIAPRRYYRCTHKYDLGCSATKQVQPKMDKVEVVYHGAHNHIRYEGSENLDKRSNVDGTDSSQISSVGIPFGGDLVEFSSKSSIENPYNPDEVEFDPDPMAGVEDDAVHNIDEFFENLDKRSNVDGSDSSRISSVGIPFGGDLVEFSSKSSIGNPYNPDEVEFDPDPIAGVEDDAVHNIDEFFENLGQDSAILLENMKLYFSLFPLDYEFDKDSLFQLWIAEGFITELTERVEDDLCSVYFNRLLVEGFLVPSGYDHSCDKLKYKVNEAKIGKRLMFDDNKLDDIPASSRHLSLCCVDINHRTSAAIKKCELLSTFLLFPHHDSSIKHIPRDIYLSLKGLHVLNLSQSGILEVPSSIGSMRSLLYLDVSKTPIKWLPESIGCLQQLQTLKLRCCFNLLGLPKATNKLINLRHLEIDVVRQLNSMPAGLGHLKYIQTLSAFIIGEYDGCRIGELKNLSKLSGEFCIVRLENVVDSNEAIEAALWDKKYLQKLELKWSDSGSETNNEVEKILEHLQPHYKLQELKIYFYSGSKLPSWISNPLYVNLVSISFYKCRNCQFLQSIGTLPSLRFLYINEMNCVKEISRQFFRNDPDQVGCSFPKLEKLAIDVMLGLEEWKEIEFGDLPCLFKLTMQCCPELVTLPSFSGLKSLKHLEVIDCPKLPSLPEGLPTSLEFLLVKDCPALKERCSYEGGEDWQKVSHVPSIWIDLEEISPQT